MHAAVPRFTVQVAVAGTPERQQVTAPGRPHDDLAEPRRARRRQSRESEPAFKASSWTRREQLVNCVWVTAVSQGQNAMIESWMAVSVAGSQGVWTGAAAARIRARANILPHMASGVPAPGPAYPLSCGLAAPPTGCSP